MYSLYLRVWDVGLGVLEVAETGYEVERYLLICDDALQHDAPVIVALFSVST